MNKWKNKISKTIWDIGLTYRKIRYIIILNSIYK